MTYSQKTLELSQVIADTCTSCNRCMKDCLFLQTYCKNPKELFERFLADDIKPIVPYSCTLCGRCSVVCPLQLKLDEAFLSMRQDLCAEGLPLKELKSVTIHQWLSTSRLFSGWNVRKSG